MSNKHQYNVLVDMDEGGYTQVNLVIHVRYTFFFVTDSFVVTIKPATIESDGLEFQGISKSVLYTNSY